MLPEQLRTALGELNGQRDVHVIFDAAESCLIRNAFLVPAEADNILKLTDGASEFLIDVKRVAWVRISEPGGLHGSS